MIVVRHARPDDVERLLGLARRAGPGMTSLKPDRDAIAARLDRVHRTLLDQAEAAEQGYLFLMEDLATRQAVGVCGIETAVGLDQPFYTYRLGTMVHASRELGVWNRMLTLYLSNDLTGYSELCSLFLAPDHRRGGLGALLSKSRMMFLAEFPQRFPGQVCAEMRGVFDETGRSPFWEALGHHFFGMEFDRADTLSALGKKAFIAELMPKYPVYVDFLPDEARAVIGLTHPETAPARRLLEGEGLRMEQHIDIFEAGPVLEARLSDLRANRESRIHPVSIMPTLADVAGPRWLASNRKLADFRVIQVDRPPAAGGDLPLTPDEALALGVLQGDPVRCLPLFPPRNAADGAPSP